jgi:hypothetical protein
LTKISISTIKDFDFDKAQTLSFKKKEKKATPITKNESDHTLIYAG